MMEKRTLYIVGAVVLAALLFTSGRKLMGPRGIRNNNPGNIRMTGIDWKGKVPHSENTDGEFEQFETAAMGLRALARNLKTYYDNGIVTIADIINRWSPEKGRNSDGSTYTQNTSAYVDAVSEKVGLGPYEIVRPGRNLEPLISAIIYQENGVQPYTQQQIQQAITDAGWQINQWS